jgi:WD40 repeat protein/serine/threonine protein kinase
MTLCPYQARLSQFLDHQLDEVESRAIELHAETCSLCAEELERLTASDGKGLPLPPILLGDSTPQDSAPAADGELPAIPGYVLLRVLGRGGRGIVYLADDSRLRRRVALKMIRAGNSADLRDLARFRIEMEAHARLQHPNIIPIYEVGDCRGRPYFAMEYMDGGTLRDRLGGGLPPSRDAAQLIETLSRAMHYAHQRGVLHRDLTPANVLFRDAPRKDLNGHENQNTEEQETITERPTSLPRVPWCPSWITFTPKITDFGLARFLDGEAEQTRLTLPDDVLGTASYMAPEQATGKVKEIGTLTDVYGLGATLYKTLTGHAPFEGASSLEILEKVRTEAPTSPRHWRPEVPADLEAICLKCLEKEPARRYASAEQLAEELGRFLRGEPLPHTRRVRTAERVWRWCRRNPAVAIAAGLAAFLLIATAAVSLGWAIDASRLAASVQAALAENHLDRGLVEAEHGDVGLGLLWMAHSLETVASGADDLAWTVRANLAGWRCRLFALTSCSTPPGQVLGFSPDGRSAWTLDPDNPKRVRRWELSPGKYAGPTLEHPGPVTTLAVSRDGKLVGTACTDGTVWLWNPATGLVERALARRNTVRAVALDPDGRTVLIGRDEPKEKGTVFQAWEIATGQPLGSVFRQPSRVRGLAFSPDGSTLLTLSDFSKTVSRWEMPSGRFLGAMLPHPVHGGILPHQASVLAVAYSPDGRTILTGAEDRAARLWEAASGRLLAVLYHREPVTTVAFGPDGRTLLTASSGDAIRVWEGAAAPKPLQVLDQPGAVRALAVSSDGTWVVSGSDDRMARVWHVVSEKLVLVHELRHASPLASVTMSRDGKLLATSTHQDNAAMLWEVASGRLLAVLPHSRPVGMMAFSPNGTRLATASYDCTARRWDTANGQSAGQALRHDAAVVSVAFSPDGRTLLTSSEDHTARLWDAATGDPIGQPLEHGSGVLDVAFSPDSRVLLTGSADGTARRWDAATGAPIGPDFRHGYKVWAVAFSPDGRTILTGSWDHTARLWDAVTGERRGAPLRHAAPIWTVAFSRDGRWVITASQDSTARLWDAATGRPLGPPLPHDDAVSLAAVGPDQRWVVTAGMDRTVQLWPTPAPVAGAMRQVVLEAQVLTGMELDSGGGVQVLDASAWHERQQRLQAAGGSPMP